MRRFAGRTIIERVVHVTATMFRLGRNSDQLLGIDISSTSIKLVELSRVPGSTGERYRVEAFAVEPLPATAVVERQIADIDAAGHSLARAVAKSGSRTRCAAVAVSGSAVITKTIAIMASLSDAEMETQIQLEADQYIPYPLEEVNLDFDVVGPTVGDAELVDVVVAASRRENVEDRVAVLEAAGLRARIVDVEAYAMENACMLAFGRLAGEWHDQTVAVADIGATTTTLHVLRDGRSIYTRVQSFGGNQLLDEIQRRSGIGRLEALRKLRARALPEGFEAEVLGPFREALARQIARALQFFYSASTYNRTDRVVLTGGCAGLPEINAFVEQRLGLPVSIASPFGQTDFAPSIDIPAATGAAPTMMIATGLALRSFG